MAASRFYFGLNPGIMLIDSPAEFARNVMDAMVLGEALAGECLCVRATVNFSPSVEDHHA